MNNVNNQKKAMINIYKRHSSCFEFSCGTLVDLDSITLINPWSETVDEVIFLIEDSFITVDCSEEDYKLLVTAWKRTREIYNSK